MIVAGMGLRRDAGASTLRGLLAEAEARTGLRPDLVTVLADKAGHAALEGLDLPVRPIGRDRLRGVKTASRSARIEAAFGTGSVAEALALVLVGTGGELVLPRLTAADGLATIALAAGEVRP